MDQHVVNTNPSAPLASPYGSNTSFTSSPYAQHTPNTFQHPMSQGGLFTANPYDVPPKHGTSPFDMTNPLTTTGQQRLLLAEKKPLDLSMVLNETDRGVITRVHRNMINLKEDVPFFEEKTIHDMGHAYKITFRWTDDYWEYDSQVINEKIISIPGVEKAHYGKMQITIIVNKSKENGSSSLNTSLSTNNASSSTTNITDAAIDGDNPDFPSLDYKDPITTKLYQPQSQHDVQFIHYILKCHPSMPPIQKGLLLTFMKSIRQENRNAKRNTNNKGGIRKSKKRYQ